MSGGDVAFDATEEHVSRDDDVGERPMGTASIQQRVAHPEEAAQRLVLMVGRFRHDERGEPPRTCRRTVRQERQKAQIERRVVGHDHRAPAEAAQFRDEFAQRRLSPHHAVVDPVDRGDERRYPATRVDQRLERRDDLRPLPRFGRRPRRRRTWRVDSGRFHVDEGKARGADRARGHGPQYPPARCHQGGVDAAGTSSAAGPGPARGSRTAARRFRPR